MRYKLGQPAWRKAWAGLVGTGILERARAMSLGLLGMTAAVGLAIVALALNQGWPLVPGGSIPQVPKPHEAVGVATVAGGTHVGRPAAPRAGSRIHSGRPSRPSAPVASGDAGGAEAPAPAPGTVVAPAEPTKPGGKTAGHGATPPPAKEPASSKPQHASPAPAPAKTEPAPPSTPVSTPAPPPVATTSEAPPEEESSVPPWSHGHGHAYGRDEEWHDHHGDEGE